MSTALAVYHGAFGRAALYRLNRPLAPHAHREGHIIILVEGTPGELVVDGTVVRADYGQAVAISPWQPHQFIPGDLGRGSVFLTLYVTPRWFFEMSRGLGPAMRFGSTAVPLDDGIRALATRLSALLADGVPGRDFGRPLADLTTAAFEASWAIGTGETTRAWPHLSDYRIRNALRLMNERVTDTVMLDRVARDVGLSRPHFYKLFRQNIGVTPNIYLNTLRLERSIERLTTSEEPVTSIGLDIGFASQASFTRFFSNNIGIAPTDYRRASHLT